MIVPKVPTAKTLLGEVPQTPTRSTPLSGVLMRVQVMPPSIVRSTVPACPTANEVSGSALQMPSRETSLTA